MKRLALHACLAFLRWVGNGSVEEACTVANLLFSLGEAQSQEELFVDLQQGLADRLLNDRQQKVREELSAAFAAFMSGIRPPVVCVVPTWSSVENAVLSPFGPFS